MSRDILFFFLFFFERKYGGEFNIFIMSTAVIIDCVRTPIGRAHRDKGMFRDARSDDLAVACVEALVKRTGIDPSEIEDVVLGNTQQTMEQGLNVARTVACGSWSPTCSCTAARSTCSLTC